MNNNYLKLYYKDYIKSIILNHHSVLLQKFEMNTKFKFLKIFNINYFIYINTIFVKILS